MYDPSDWANIFENAGAKYVVLTSSTTKDIRFGQALRLGIGMLLI
jgi:hypothetical protein